MLSGEKLYEHAGWAEGGVLNLQGPPPKEPNRFREDEQIGPIDTDD